MEASLNTPGLKRRLICMIYEGMLLFGIIFLAVFLFSVAFHKREEAYVHFLLQAWLFITIGAYFVWFWSQGRRTLAMKTWGVRLVMADGGPVPIRRAMLRYVICWLGVAPGIVIAWLLGAKHSMLLLIPLLNMFIWATAAVFDADGQYIQDRLTGTRLVLSSNR